jgi:hypothetical protein
MKFSIAALFFAALSVPVSSPAADAFNLPEAIGPDPTLSRIDGVQTWDPDTMYEHVNGEAELLKRYGAVSLTFVSYENDNGDYLGIDLLDLGKPINAYGLYRLYAGCDGTEYNFSEATVLADEYAPHAVFGPYFFRFNVDLGEDAGGGKELVDDFLKQFIINLPEQPPLPATLSILQQKALQPCEVNYHPEQVDYDLESGPGYTWIGPDEQHYFITVLSSQDEAERQADILKNKGVKTLLTRGNAVVWQKNDGNGSTAYMAQTLQDVVRK